jgi:hypothetical protein
MSGAFQLDRRARILAGVLGAVSIGSGPAHAEGRLVMQIGEPVAPLRLSLPLFDVPANLQGHYTAPSMQQSKGITADLYELGHYTLADRLGRRSFGAFLAISAFDAATVMVSVPFFAGWQHEEWHRAVLERRRISSDNPYYGAPTLPLFGPKTVQVADADVERLKREHPVDYTRVGAAGVEGQYALADELERNAFFYDQPTTSGFIIGMSYAAASVYSALCASRPQGTGDCALWADGLFAPTAPPHQEGQPLPPAAERFMRRQAALSFLNFVDPFVFLFRGVEVDGTRWNAALRSVPTSFGFDVRLDLFHRRGVTGMVLALHSYLNDARYFPGGEVELVARRVGPLRIGGRVNAWLQPDGQSVSSHGARPGGNLVVVMALPLASGRLDPYLELDAKTAGWVTGNARLEAGLAARLGLAVNLF